MAKQARWAVLNDPRSLDVALAENFAPGEPVSVIVGLPRAITREEFASVVSHLRSRGMNLIRADYVSTSEWSYALQLDFRRPSRSGYAVLPLAVLIIGALGIIGIGSFVGFKLGNVMDSLAKNMVPIALIGVAGWVLVTYLGKQPSKA
ncbi:MAG: hypothetical protein ABIH46_13005 [Chloroflexota bacterium]